VHTDRLGGRQRYGPFLYPLFGGAHFNILEQEPDRQLYEVRAEAPRRRLTIGFRVEGESHCFTTALASMAAKYVRELHMRLFNEWWQERHRELGAGALLETAGYPQDAARFLAEVGELCARLSIDRTQMVRLR
jgi:hypothetical protein